MKKIIKIDGMKCDKCANVIKSNLDSIEGIKNVLVDLEKKEATIEYDKELNLELIKEKIDDLGFSVIDN